MLNPSKEEWEFLQSEISSIYAKTKPHFSSQETYESIVETWDFFNIPASDKVRYNLPELSDIWTARLIAFQYALMTPTVQRGESAEHLLYSSLLETISNTIVAVMRLAEDGLDYQAMTLVRNLFELYMTLIIITESPEKRKAFMTAHEPEDARKVWSKYFSREKFFRMIEAYCVERPEMEKVTELFKEWINGNYGTLSSYAHNDYAHLIVATRSKEDANGQTYPNIWGRFVTWQDSIYGLLVTVALPSHLLFMRMLKEHDVDIGLDYLLSADLSMKEVVLELQNLISHLGGYTGEFCPD